MLQCVQGTYILLHVKVVEGSILYTREKDFT